MKVYFDGGCRPNPGAIETAVIAGGKLFHRTDHGHGDNNDAEWLALIDALRVAKELGLEDVTLLGDSALVVDQANGATRRIAPRFGAHLVSFHALADGFKTVCVRRIGRKQNLAGIALERVSSRL